ncbi:carbohydrate ABC transporter permease [Paramicrobacterium chengjingii]|uniref:carbohydrate ABC transporter permease n=1 Tax=Paramicrobacterium chengjingii TaxID=2769067 RepID=UPI00141FDA3F|nr:sugar ABC transporter permease [Microbacterium chengjingii]
MSNGTVIGRPGRKEAKQLKQSNFVRSPRSFWPFLLPALIGVIALIAVPIGFTFYYSLRNYNLQLGTDQFAGLSNYIRLFTGENAEFVAALFRTFGYVILVIAIDFVLAMTQALLVFSMKQRWAKLWKVVFILPILVIPTASAVFWRNVMYSPHGGEFLKVLGLDGVINPPLGDPKLAFWAIIVVVVWAWSPWVFILFSNGLDQLDQAVIEASKMDGASYFQRLRNVIFPLMGPVIFVTLSFKALDSFLSFPFVWLLTQGGPGGSTHILSTYIYEQAFNLLDYGNGSAMAIIMLLISGVLSVAAVLGWQRYYGKDS